MTKPEKVPFCDVEYHPHPSTPGIPTHIHKQQLGDALRRVQQLEAENRALKAQLGVKAWRRDTPEGDLLIGLAEAFDIAHAFAHEAGQANQTDVEGRRGKPESSEPRGGSKGARNALRDLIRGVESRLESFHNRRENGWQSPKVDFGTGPRVRCWTRGCPHYSHTITDDECPGCGKRVANPELQAEPKSA